MDNQSISIQQLFFESIRHRLPVHISLVHEIAEALGISYDSAYRRLRGEKNLSIHEIKILSNKYRISVDSLLGISNADIIFHPFVIKGDEGFEDWLQFRILELKKINESADTELIMVARDLPVWHYFNFPELAAFKIYFWKKMLLHDPEYRIMKFSFSLLSDNLFSLGSKLLTMYNGVSSIEIWSQETFYRIMQQIDFCRISGFFTNKKDSVLLFEKLEALIKHIQFQTEMGFKFNPAYTFTENEDENFHIYFNELLLIDNTLLVKRDGIKKVFMTHNSLDILQTTNPDFCNQIDHALKTIIKTGNRISGSAGTECQRIFNGIYKKLEFYINEPAGYDY